MPVISTPGLDEHSTGRTLIDLRRVMHLRLSRIYCSFMRIIYLNLVVGYYGIQSC